MKVTVTNGGPAEMKYPKLMGAINNPWKGSIFYFTAPGCGICLMDTGIEGTGGFSEDWCMGEFKDFTGSITLSND